MPNFAVKTVTSNYNMTPQDSLVKVVASAAVSVGLPTISAVVEGDYYTVLDAGQSAATYNIIVASTDGTLINGSATTVTIAVNGGSIVAQRVNGSWFVINDVNAVQSAATSTDLAIAKFSGTSGKALLNTGILVSSANAMSGQLWSVSSQANVTYTLVASDTGKVIEMNSTVSRVLTLPNSFAQGFRCDVVQAGTSPGKVVFTAAAGATLTGNSAVTTTAGIWARCSLYVSSNSSGTNAVWVLSGNVG